MFSKQFNTPNKPIDNENGVPTLHGYMHFRYEQNNNKELDDPMSL